MKKTMPISINRKLWYDGPNYTADSVIINTIAQKILLIKRSSGEWALPGGFINSEEDSFTAAIRETKEETGTIISDDPILIYKGLVNDPRNSQTSWIETSAYLFIVNELSEVSGRDDAIDAAWLPLNNLPKLYASHDEIVARAIDYLSCRSLIKIAEFSENYRNINGGHMQYDKIIATKNDHSVFIKRTSTRYDDIKRNRLRQYLRKEAFTMSYLRCHGYSGIPSRSILRDDDTFIMDTMTSNEGWLWRAKSETLDTYIKSAKEKFDELENIPLPPDTFDIESSRDSFIKEGWASLDEQKIAKLRELSLGFLDRLTPHSQNIAKKLLADLPALLNTGGLYSDIKKLVFCHHDIRQSNMAWHPKRGTKLIDWSWSGPGKSGSDITSLLIDLHKSGHNISNYYKEINLDHCLTLMGFWLNHATWPYRGDDTLRFQQFLSVLSAYEIYTTI